MNWRDVTSLKEWGGLRLKYHMVFNKALLRKWIWRFGEEKKAFFRGMVAEKYGIIEGGLMTRNTGTLFRFGLWRSIFRGGKSLVDISLLGWRMEAGLVLRDLSGEENELREVFPNI